ncbi:UNVERIFIED_CONTAM: hypothetical protein Sradi_5421200 [Sesamum radiatum]|uniref:Uncharacterized protein n=1 Tax=Sesamum radiatum TaxID=300843 RepID=A0AAW2LAR5_SESRA
MSPLPLRTAMRRRSSLGDIAVTPHKRGNPSPDRARSQIQQMGGGRRPATWGRQAR